MTILITGVAGLIGSRLASYILDNYPDTTVVGIDNLKGGYEDHVDPREKFYCLSLDEELHALDNIFAKYQFDYVFHLAAYAAEGLSPFIRNFNYRNNILSTVNIINCCINYNVKRLVYTSSMSVYGHGIKEGVPFDEETPLAPIDPYGISKYACELDIKVAGIQHGLDWCIIRPHNVFGVNQNIWDPYRNVLGIWMNKILHDDYILIYGDGNQIRAFTFIDNILPCLFKAAIEPNCSKEIINLGGIEFRTLNDACITLCHLTGYDKVKYAEARLEAKWAVPSYEKSVKLLDYKDSIDFETGLKIMWEWAKNEPDRGQVKWDSYEISRGLYSYWK